MKIKLLLLTILFCTVAGVASANNNPPNNGEETKKTDIAGGVIHADNKKPLGNVSVTAYSNSKKEKVVVTDGNGNYSFSDLKPGTYRLVFEKSGYRKVTKEKVTIRSDEGCQLNIEMDEEAEFRIMPGQLFSDFE
ncbi:MAG TPA: carboxypeptidase-like regulatory domain-containing protein [Flavisolibacter sp.]|nr:carboxypeptidase-like regulatory domain-containing protein [Flavisolibacter sp.]